MSKSGEQNKCSILPAEKQTDKSITHNISLGGKMKNLRVLMVAFLVLGLTGVMMADVLLVEEHDGTTMSGTVPFCASCELTDDDVTPFTSEANIAAYDSTFITVENLIKITDFDCNTMYKITAGMGDWTVPADYLTGGAKREAVNSDLLLYVDNITGGYASAGMAALGAFGTNYTVLVKAGSDILGGGLYGAGVGHGVEDAVADVNARVLMDWSEDIVGAYSVTVTLTITEVTE